MRLLFISAALLLLGAAAQAQQLSPCARTPAPHAPANDQDAVRCQAALDAQSMGELSSKLNATTALLTVERQDLQKAQAEKAAAAKKNGEWEAYAKPLNAAIDTLSQEKAAAEKTIADLNDTVGKLRANLDRALAEKASLEKERDQLRQRVQALSAPKAKP